MSDEKVPFLDLVTVHRGLQDEFVDILKTALSTAGFIGVPMVQGFEQDFAQFAHHGSAWALAAAQMPYGLR